MSVTRKETVADDGVVVEVRFSGTRIISMAVVGSTGTVEERIVIVVLAISTVMVSTLTIRVKDFGHDARVLRASLGIRPPLFSSKRIENEAIVVLSDHLSPVNTEKAGMRGKTVNHDSHEHNNVYNIICVATL